MNMKQTILKTGTILLLLGAMVTACEKIDTDDSWSFTQLRIDIVFTDTPYLFTYNGEAFQKLYPSGQLYYPLYVSRRDTAGRFCAYRDEETLELDTVLHFRPGSTLTFIQLPGETIKFYNSGEAEAEPNPANSACTKVRFTYQADFSEADSLRLIWMSSKKANLNLPGAKADALDTVMLYRKGLSRYVEFDTERYRAEDSNTYFFYTRQTWNGSAWTGSAKTAVFTSNGSNILSRYKFATCQFQQSNGIIAPLFGTLWEE
jgi:hypothetical protein